MRCATWVVTTSMVAAVAACSLTTSLNGLSNGDVVTGSPGGDASSSGDAAVEASAGNEGGSSTEGGTGDSGVLDYRALVLADAPLAYYRLADQGETAKDETGAHDGVYKGTVTHAGGAISGDTNGAAVFDGMTGYVDVGDVLPFMNQSPYTIEAWASPVNGATDPACIAAKSFAPGGVSGGLSDGYTLYLDNGSHVVELARYRNSADDTLGGSALGLDTFSHVVATYDGSTMTIWVNGVLASNASSTRSLGSVTSPLVIGAGRGGIYCYFRGALDEVAFYGAALTGDRIRAHYAAGTK